MQDVCQYRFESRYLCVKQKRVLNFSAQNPFLFCSKARELGVTRQHKVGDHMERLAG